MIRLVLPWIYLRMQPPAACALRPARAWVLAMLWSVLDAIFQRSLKNFSGLQSVSNSGRSSFYAWRALVAAPARFAAP